MESRKKVWSSSLSVSLSSVIIKVIALIFAAGCVYAPFAIQSYSDYYYKGLAVSLPLTFYACAVFAFIALFFLNKLIGNIKKDSIFIPENVKILRILSWCCYFVSIITIAFSNYLIFSDMSGKFVQEGMSGWSFAFAAIASAAAFMGLILRVLKNVFDKAVALREESDYTI